MLQDHLVLSVVEMERVAKERLERKIDPETKIKLEERKKYLESQREAQSCKINFSKTKTQIIGKDTSQLELV